MKIEIGLSVSSIRKAIEQIRDYRESLDEKCKEIVEKLSALGVETAKSYVVSLNAVFESDLLNSVHDEVRKVDEGYGMAVVADSEHAIFVEFGTGNLNGGEPYIGDLPQGYKYGGGSKYTTLTRPFKGHSVGSYGWFYFKNGEFWFCEGMESRPFMFNTSEDLRREIDKIVKEVFENG